MFYSLTNQKSKYISNYNLKNRLIYKFWILIYSIDHDYVFLWKVYTKQTIQAQIKVFHKTTLFGELVAGAHIVWFLHDTPVKSIYKFGLSVCLYPINVKMAEPIGPKFLVGHHVTTGKVYESSKFQKFVSIKIRSSLNFL